MKKYVSILLAIVIGSSVLCSCGKKSSPSSDTDGGSETAVGSVEDDGDNSEEEAAESTTASESAESATESETADEDDGNSSKQTTVATRTFSGDRMTELYFVSCTSLGMVARGGGNVFKMEETPWASDAVVEGLSSEAAWKLIEQVSALPDAESDEGELAFIIRIKYIKDGQEILLEKRGYDTFPENWKEIVATTNEVAKGYCEVSDKTEIMKVDALYIRTHCDDLNEKVLPKDVTLEDVIESRHIDYLTIYDPDQNRMYGKVQPELIEYLFDYYGISEYVVRELDDDPPKSSYGDMIMCAENIFRMKDLNDGIHGDDSSVSTFGKHDGYEYQIVRYDSLYQWMNYWNTRPGDSHQFVVEDGCVKYQSEENGPDDGMMTLHERDDYVFVDKTGQYLILVDSNSINFEDVAEVLGVGRN